MKVDCVHVDTVSGLMEELIVQTQKEKPSLNLSEDQITILKHSMTEKLLRFGTDKVELLSGR